MLEFAAHVNREWPTAHPSRDAAHKIEALFFRSSEIVCKRFSEVISVREWLPNNLRPTCVNRLQVELRVVSSGQQLHFTSKLLHQVPIQPDGLAVSAIGHAIGCFIQLPRALTPRPRSHCCDCAVHVSKSCQTFQR